MNIGDLTATLGADYSGLNHAEQAMRNFEAKAQASMARVSKHLDVASDAMKRFGRRASLFITAPIVAAGGYAFKMASDMEESMNKVNVAFRTDSEEVKKWSETTLNSFGIAQNTALDMASTFGDMSTSLGLTTSQAAEMSTKLVGLAGDLASFKNISIDIANTALTAIFTGETESLKRLGIVMTEVNLKEYALSKGIKTRIRDMTQAEKVQLRYNYVLEMTRNSQGDFQRTSEGAANQTRIFQESLKEVGATFGEILLPIITPVIKRINKLMKSFKDLDENQRKWILRVAVIAAAVGPASLALGIFAKGLSTIVTIGSQVIKFFNVLRVVMITNPILAVAAAFGTLLLAMTAFRKEAEYTLKTQKQLNEELEKTKILKLSEGFDDASKSIEEYIQVINTLNKSQLEGVKSQIDQRLQMEDELGAKLLAKIGKVNDGITVLERGSAEEQAAIEYASHLERIKRLDEFLKIVESRIKEFNKKEVSVVRPKMQMGKLTPLPTTMPTTEGDYETLANSITVVNDKLITLQGTAFAVGDTVANMAYQMGVAFVDASKGIMGMIDTLLAAIRQIIVANLAEAITNMIKVNVKFGLPGLALAAVGIGGIMTLWERSKSKIASEKIPGMARGGIVPSGFPNDSYQTRLSSGEMVLPKPIGLDKIETRQDIYLQGELEMPFDRIYLRLKRIEKKLGYRGVKV